MMLQIKDHGNPLEPPAISSDGNDSYPKAMLEAWGKIAALFRELAQEIEVGGRVEASTNIRSLGVNPLPPIKLEIEYKPSKRELEIQVNSKKCLRLIIRAGF